MCAVSCVTKRGADSARHPLVVPRWATSVEAIDRFTRADTLAEHLRPLLPTVVRVGRVHAPGDWKSSWPGPPASAAVNLRATLSPSLTSSPRHLPARAVRGPA